MSKNLDIKRIIANMTLEQKIGQMFFARRFDKDTEQLIKKGKLGGLHIGVVHNPDYIRRIQKMSPIPMPLFMASNMERGYITGLPCAMAVGAIGSQKVAYQWAEIAAIEARSVGVNFVFGPVLDVAMTPETPHINLRSFGSDLNEVVRLGTAVIKGFQDNGVVVSAKHYPGCGGSPVDSHIELCVLKCTEKEFKERELKVYKKVMEQVALTGVMSGHILVPCIDKKYLATVSRKLIDYLRNIGFDGLVITDSLAMRGIKSQMKTEDIFFQALRAGNDMILGDYNLSTNLQYKYMLRAVKNGAVTEEQINKSVMRIFTAKEYVTKNSPTRKVDFKSHKQFAWESGCRAITRVLNSGRMKKLGSGDEVVFLIAHEDIQEERNLVKLLKKKFPKAKLMIVPGNPNAREIEEILNLRLWHREIVFIAYALPIAYKGTADLPPPLAALIGGLKERIKILVLIGNPYAARVLPALSCFIFSYTGNYVHEAVVGVLAGEITPRGKLPISLKFRGH